MPDSPIDTLRRSPTPAIPLALPLALAIAALLASGHVDAARTKAKHPKPHAASAAATAPKAACSDYYQQVNGAWLAANPAPATGSVSAFDQMIANARAQERQLLEDDARAASDATGRALGELWSSGMDEAAIESAGATPLKPLFDRIDAAKKSRDLPAVIADLHAAGVPVLFNFSADVDLKDFDRQLGYATQGGLGLPDPDFYTRPDADTRALLGRYRAYVERILAFSGTPAAQLTTQSGWIIAIEMQLAQASLPLVQLRDPNSTYQPVTLKDLQARYPHLEFAKFLRVQHADDDRVSLAQAGFFQALDGLLATVPVEQWNAYLRFHVANALAPYLSKNFQNAHYELYERVLDGLQQPQPRWIGVLDALDGAVGPSIGRQYTERYLPDASLAAAKRVADGLRAAMQRAIARNGWMSPPTRAIAQAKLDKLRIEIGQPGARPDLNGLQLGRGSFAGNLLAAAAWQHQRDMAAIGKRTQSRRWPVLPQVPDVSYDLVQNRVVVTAAFLQPPVFDGGADVAQQYGALGALIGHQLHYAFDSKGRTIDADGQLRDWWTPSDSAAYAARTAPIVAQYDNYPAFGAVKVDGNHTRDENLADLAGVELAWDAFQALIATQPLAGSGTALPHADVPMPRAQDAQERTPEQRFFASYARVWERNAAADTLTAEASSSIQAPVKFRVNGVLANLPAFGKAYACKAGQPMQLASPVAIWR
jgi:putative endopeptidase